MSIVVRSGERISQYSNDESVERDQSGKISPYDSGDPRNIRVCLCVRKANRLAGCRFPGREPGVRTKRVFGHRLVADYIPLKSSHYGVQVSPE